MSKIRFGVDVDGKKVGRKIRRRIEAGIDSAASEINDGMRREAKEKIRNENAIFRGELLEGFANAKVTFGDSTVASLRNLADHAPYQDRGVSGVYKNRNTPYKYKNKKPPLASLIPWVEQNLNGSYWPEDDLGPPPSGFYSGDRRSRSRPTGGSGGVTVDDTDGIDPNEQLIRPDPLDTSEEDEIVQVDDWGDWEPWDSRLWVGQRVKYEAFDGGAFDGEVTEYGEDYVKIRRDSDSLIDFVRFTDPDYTVLEYENWYALNPLRKRQSIIDELTDLPGADMVDGGATPRELKEVYANWVAFDLFDGIKDERVIRKLVSKTKRLNKRSGAGVAPDFPASTLYLRESKEVIKGNPNNLTPSDRDYWVENYIIRHETQHQLGNTYNYRTSVEGTYIANQFNKRSYTSFKNNLPPFSFDRDGKPLNKWPNWVDEHKSAWWYMFSKKQPGDSLSDEPQLEDVLGWNEWKDDVSHVTPSEPTDWMPKNGDPMLNALEAANRAWWKQVLTITNDSSPLGKNSHKATIGVGYSATHAHETLAMTGELLWNKQTPKFQLEALYLYHPYLVKTMIYLQDADPSVKSKLEQLAKNNGWDDLLDYL